MNTTDLMPNRDVAKIEDDFIKNSGGIGAISNLQLTAAMPRRPGFGTQGTPIVVYANYFQLTPTKGLSLYRYNVQVTEVNRAPKLSKLKLKRLIQLLLEQPPFSGSMSDFKSMLVTRNRIPDTPLDVVIPFRAEGEDELREDPFNYRITVDDTGIIQVDELLNYLKTSDPATPQFGQPAEILQALNNVVGHFAQSRSDVSTIAQNKHYLLDRDPANLRILGGGMEALRGYFKSVRLGTGRLLLNVNVCHGVFYEPLRLDEIMKKLGTAKKTNLAKYLKYLRVRRLHLKAKKNRAGIEIPNWVTIWDVATTNDGTNAENPPQVKHFAAGPKDVKFFLNAVEGSQSGKSAKSPGKAASKKKPAGPAAAGGYVSVWDYFKQSQFVNF